MSFHTESENILSGWSAFNFIYSAPQGSEHTVLKTNIQNGASGYGRKQSVLVKGLWSDPILKSMTLCTLQSLDSYCVSSGRALLISYQLYYSPHTQLYNLEYNIFLVLTLKLKKGITQCLVATLIKLINSNFVKLLATN